MAVAIAAPFTPRAGTGPQPKIKRGSKAALMNTANIIIMLGILASPVARIAEFPIKGTTTKRTVKYQNSI